MTRHKAKRKITLPRKPAAEHLAPTSWDAGAMGPANRENLHCEPATDINPETGRQTPNPNGVRRWRRMTWVNVYHRQHKLTSAQAAAADQLAIAAAGLPDRDPLAALGEVACRGGDPQVARVDARREFFRLFARVPPDCRFMVERVVLDDLPITHGNPAQRERHMKRLARGLDAIA